MDLNVQSDGRFHRLDSPEDVDSFRVMTTGTVDIRLESMQADKESSADLALDGKLASNRTEEVSVFDLIQIARKEFTVEGTVPEEALEREWPALRERLRKAWKQIEEKIEV
jgi:hypothetical protein